MATSRKTAPKGGAKPPSAASRNPRPQAASRASGSDKGGTSARQSMSGPSAKRPAPPSDRADAKAQSTEALVAAIPHNANKAAEYTRGGKAPPAPEGAHAAPDNPDATASTLSEGNDGGKNGGPAEAGRNPTTAPLQRQRVDSGGRALTTNQGVAVADNQHSLKAGARGPTLLEDFILREKITHFDHERIPERVVHARGSGAHGFFECTEDITALTQAAPFAQVGKRTPVFVRFSTVAGERGSADTVRDVRGFAVKFYTDEGNWDLVGNNIPVFFIQDAIKFPDLVHAVKPEPHHQMPQASSAHDSLWDFISLMPESTHMILWVMSDRAVPRSFRTMQGFGVHTFRFVNAEGAATLVKFHWTPVLGTHSLDWDEAVKINGADPDFHRRDLWEAIEAGAYPEYLLQVQTFSEEQSAAWSFDVLDATKIVPEELVPLRTVGRLVLDRNPDNFFAETEQIAFCTQHVIPGIDFTSDPLLQGRNFSYHDTQLTRLGGPNFAQIPINAPLAEVHNNQRDGLHQHAVHRGRANYEPNSLGGGCPFQAGAMKGFTSFAERLRDEMQKAEPSKLRTNPEKFAEHFNQARLFWRSQSPVEQAHIVRAFRFELTRVQTQAVRERMVAQLRNVAEDLASQVAEGLGMPLPEALPRALAQAPDPEVDVSPALSLLSRPGDGRILGRRVALLVCDGVDGAALKPLYEALTDAGAMPRYVGPRLGTVASADGSALPVEVTLEAAPSVLFDAVVLPPVASGAPPADGLALEFVQQQYRHCKPMLVPSSAAALLAQAGIPEPAAEDSGLLQVTDDGVAGAAQAFVEAIARHRAWERQTDPPRV